MLLFPLISLNFFRRFKTKRGSHNRETEGGHDFVQFYAIHSEKVKSQEKSSASTFANQFSF